MSDGRSQTEEELRLQPCLDALSITLEDIYEQAEKQNHINFDADTTSSDEELESLEKEKDGESSIFLPDAGNSGMRTESLLGLE